MTVWLITGCSSGFGKEIAQAALKKGDTVLATCRNDVSRLSELEKEGAIILELDISASTEVIGEFVRSVLALPAVKLNGGVDILVHNAGYVQVGGVEELSKKEFMECFNTNFFGHLALTQAFLPEFRKRRSGTIAFIGSVGGFMNFPGGSAYTTAKYAIAGLAESLAVEMQPFNVQVTCIEPGAFRTSVFKGNNYKVPSNPVPEYDNSVVGITRRFYTNPSYEEPGDPSKGSQRIVDLLRGDWPAIARGQPLPVRLALGDDAHEHVKERYELRLKENEEWQKWCCGVTFE